MEEKIENQIENIFDLNSKSIHLTFEIIEKNELCKGPIDFKSYSNLETLVIDGYKNYQERIKIDIINLDLVEKLNKIKIYDVVIKRMNLSPNVKELIFINSLIIELDYFDKLPNGLKKLVCPSMNINKLDNLPIELEYLDCSENELIHLDYLPAGLKYLNCSNNKIIKLDDLPNQLVYLDCSHNTITQLDSLPDSLEEVYAKSNQIIFVKRLPSNLKKANFINNPLVSKPNCQLSTLLLNYSLDYEKSSITDNIAQIGYKTIYNTYYGLKYITYGTGISLIGIGLLAVSPVIYGLNKIKN